MKIWKKTLSVGLSLVLCASMVAPAFAASFTELQQAINDTNTEVKVYGEKEDISAYTDDEGTRNVTLLGDVEHEENEEVSRISSKVDLVLDLNGHKIDGKGNNVYNYNGNGGGNPGAAAVLAAYGGHGNMTVKNGTITGSCGDGILTHGYDKTLKLIDVNVSGNVSGISAAATNETTVIITGGSVTDNDKRGIIFSMNAFEVSGTTISGNGTAGIDVRGGAHGTFSDMVISDNGGRGVFVGSKSEAILDGVKIENNAGGIYAPGKITVSNSTIINNHAPQTDADIPAGYGEQVKDGGGIYQSNGSDGNGTLTLGEGNTIYGNTSQAGASDIYAAVGSTIIGLSNVTPGYEGWYDAEKGIHGTDGQTSDAVNLVAHVHDRDNEDVEQHKDPTCTEAGSATYICGDYTYTEEIPATGHTNSAPVEENRVEATETVDGYYDLVTYCAVCGEEITRERVTIPATGTGTSTDTPEVPEEPDDGSDTPETPDTPVVVIPDVNVPMGGAPEEETTVIDEVEVPLAGIFTRADAIGYLWEKSGKPEAELSDFEDVPEDHTWAVAIGWAQDMGIAVADEDGNFRPDDLVLRSVEDLEIDPEGEFQQFLNRYSVYAGVADEGETFMKLDGDVDDVIMGEEAQVIFNEFFAMLEEALSQAA